MLKIARSFGELNIAQLLDVYCQTLEEDKDGRYLAEQKLYDYLREEFFSVPGSFCAFWCEQERYVSALRMEPYQNGYLLSGLETAPSARGLSFGTNLVRAVCKEYDPVYAHVHKGNVASLRLHEHCGFSEYTDYGILLDGTVSFYYKTLCYTIKT